MAHYKLFKTLTDSASINVNNDKILKIQTKLQTQEKEAKIVLLNQQTSLQQTELEKEKNARNLILATAILSIIILLLIYFRFKNICLLYFAINYFIIFVKNNKMKNKIFLVIMLFPFFLVTSCKENKSYNANQKFEYSEEFEKKLQEQLILVEDGETVEIPAGNYLFKKALSVEGKNNITIK